jgi:hypothetical protein
MEMACDGSPDPIWKKTHHIKMTGGVTQGVGPEFKPQYHKRKVP